ncbi:response regulator [Paroceanicella profunda]|uniref:histidine kinase n=1 Tax=Paroceanicella profunda TaxID=2579971 RepID=A0A5B8FT40_9RHOB|nr:response regulator [Paroceanicella profunda]QDL91545.1 response regulator [Paroceanicella profunda]
MPETVSAMLSAILDLTDDAILVIDPPTRTVRFSSPRAIELIGPVLLGDSVPVSQVFANDEAQFDDFLRLARSVTDPIISQVLLLPGREVVTVKGRRMTASDDTSRVLLLLEREAELSHRFRLISERILALRTEVGRRVLAEKRLSSNIHALRRALGAIRNIASIDVSTDTYLQEAVTLIARDLETHGALLVLDELGRLHVGAATGRFGGILAPKQTLNLSHADFTRTWARDPKLARDLLWTSLTHASGGALDPAGTLAIPVSVSGAIRGVLICVPNAEAAPGGVTQAEGDIVAEVLGNLIARAETEARLIHAQKLQAVGQLTGGIAHDFNNILAVVLGNAEILLEEITGPRLELAEEIQDAAIRGATLTSRLLAFARKQPLKPETTDINALLREIDPLLRRTIREDIDLELVSGGGLWPGRLDKSQFENAVLNLVANARDAMPEGGKLTVETANVRLDADYAAQHEEVRPGQYVMVAVSDNGTGMVPEVAQEACTPFFTTKAVGEGSGLGLSMVFGFVKQSEGHLKIYSEPGLGTTVKMYFPRDLSGNPVPAPRRPDRAESDTPRKGRILVTEDDPGVLKYVERSLTKLGYLVDAVTTGDDAARLMARNTYDVLLTDVVLPGTMNGARLAAIAKGIAPRMPVLFMSGYSENVIVHHGSLDQGVEFISKPFTRDQLASRIAALIRA